MLWISFDRVLFFCSIVAYRFMNVALRIMCVNQLCMSVASQA